MADDKKLNTWVPLALGLAGVGLLSVLTTRGAPARRAKTARAQNEAKKQRFLHRKKNPRKKR